MWLAISLVVMFIADIILKFSYLHNLKIGRKKLSEQNLKCTKDAFLQRIWIQMNR